MSAVGLLLLEDPKARARAEARIRAGKGGRRSFFGRSAYTPGKGRQPSLPATIPDEDGEDHPVIVRPSTSLSLPVPGRKKGVPSDRSSNVSRNSVFGRKNSVGELSIKSGTSSSSQHSVPISVHSGVTQNLDADRFDKIRQPAALPPFQYQQGQRSASRILETVDEKSLPAQLRAVPEYDRRVLPRNASRQDYAPSGPDSDPRAAESRSISPISMNPPSLPPACRISRFDETMFSGFTDPAIDPNDRAAQMHAVKQSLRDHRLSALLVQKEQMGRTEPVPQLPATFYDTEPSNDERSSSQQTYTPLVPAPVNANGVHHAPVERDGLFTSWDDRDVAYHSKRVLPPVPEQHQPSEKSSDSSLGSTNDSSSSSINPEIRIDRALTPNTVNIAFLSGSTSGKSPALSFTGDVRESMIFSDSTWEDDIDFVYEQGAEAACDFDWDSNYGSRFPSMHSDVAVRPSDSASRQGSVSSEVSRRDSRTLSGGGATIAERRQAQKAAEYTRGYSVGHRGFAAARNSTDDISIRKGVIPSYMNIARPMKDDNVSPSFSVTHPEDGSGTPSMVHFPSPPGGARLSEALSDPESWRNSSKHRKSSSYGSMESFARTSVANSGKDVNRWSSASGSSVPALVSSRPRRTSSLSKTTKPTTSEVLPKQSEEAKACEIGDSAYLRQIILPGAEDDDAFLLRRAQTSGARRILQAAGRQRHRPMEATGSTAPALRHYASASPMSTRSPAAASGLGWI